MKKLLFSLAIATSVASCGDSAQKQDAAAATDTAAVKPMPDSPSTAASTAQPIKDSLMQFKGGKVLIIAGGVWSELKSPVTTTNGRKVNPDGNVSKGGKTKKLEEGMMIDKDGQLMDKDGKPLDNTGWE